MYIVQVNYVALSHYYLIILFGLLVVATNWLSRSSNTIIIIIIVFNSIKVCFCSDWFDSTEYINLYAHMTHGFSVSSSFTMRSSIYSHGLLAAVTALCRPAPNSWHYRTNILEYARRTCVCVIYNVAQYSSNRRVDTMLRLASCNMYIWGTTANINYFVTRSESLCVCVCV